MYRTLCTLIFGMFLLFVTLVDAQDNTSISDTSKWIKTPLKYVNATVKMPYSTVMDKKDIYTSKGLQTLYFIKNEHKALDLSFTVALRKITAKEVKKIIQEEVNRLAVQYGGYPNTTKEKDANNLAYDYIVIYTADRRAIYNRIYIIEDNIITLSAHTPDKDKFNGVCNYFLQSFSYIKSISNTTTEKKKTTKTKSSSPTKQLKWFEHIDSSFMVHFPVEPMYKKYIIQQEDNSNYSVQNWYFQNPENKLSYLITERTYDNTTIQFPIDTLYKIAFTTLLQSNKGKELSYRRFSCYNFPMQEYVFVSRKVYYRIRYHYYKNTLYQTLLAGNKKQIYDLSNEKFFNEFMIR